MPPRTKGSGDDEPGALYGSEDLSHRLASRECHRCWVRLGTVAAEVGDPGCVPGLDGKDRACRSEHLGRLDVS